MRRIGERELMARRCGRDKSLPYKLAGRLAMMPVGGGVPDAPQISSNPCDAKDKGAVMAGRREWAADERGKGGRQPAPVHLKPKSARISVRASSASVAMRRIRSGVI